MPKTKEILKTVKKLEIKTKKLVDGLLQGAYHSIFKGRGIEFSEVRPYEPGDDIRSIDWNVTARQNLPFVKEFIEERDLTIYIIFDISKSNEFGNIKEKKDTAFELIASIMFAALRNNDKVGLCLFTEELEKFISAKKGKRHILKLIREMIYYEPKKNGTEIKKSLSKISTILKKRSTIFIVSDFIGDDFSKPLKILKTKHDVILVNLLDPREMDIPDVGYIELEDEETGEQILVDTSDENFRKEFKKLAKNQLNAISRLSKKTKVDLIQLSNEEPFEAPLRKFFRMRLRRIAR